MTMLKDSIRLVSYLATNQFTRKNIYLYDNDVIIFLEKQPNQSKYIEDLIRHDMNKQNISWSREDIIGLIEEYLQGRNIVENKIEKDKDVVMSLQSLLNM